MANDLQWTRFNDFSPGIWQKSGTLGATGSTPAPLGAATVDNTYRCRALPGGGLGPMPKKVRDLSLTDKSGANIGAGVTAAITGFCIFGPLYRQAGSTLFPPFVGSTAFEAHVAFERVQSGVQTHEWRIYQYFTGAGNAYTAKSVNLAAVTNKFGPTYFTVTRANPFSPTAPGVPIVVASWFPVEDPLTGAASYLASFPDPANPQVHGIFNYSLNPGMIIAHQTRVVSLARFVHAHGNNNDDAPTNELIVYTKPNEVATDTGGSALFGQEFPVGYGCAGSLTSSDLLLIKHYGGAYLIQGDIASPLVRRMPNVVSTAGTECVGGNSSLGYVYGVNNGGVYSWGGSDGSQLLSPQLEDGFWQTNSVLTYLYDGTFMSWGDMVLCPNNFVLDINTKSWWRIDDPASSLFYIWQRDPLTNVAYGAYPSLTSASPKFASGYDRTLPATSFSWQSQPWFATVDRLAKYREVLLCAVGSGTITITVTSLDTGTSVSKVIAVATTQPKHYRFNLAAEGTRFQLRIVSDGGATAAPIPYEVSLGYHSTNMVANS